MTRGDAPHPWPDIHLVPLTPDDVAQVNAWQNDPSVRDLIMGFHGPVRVETTAAWVESMAGPGPRSRLAYAIRRRGTLEGVAQLQAIDWVQRSALLGIYIGSEGSRGAGLGYAASALLLDDAFNGLGMHRVGLSVLAGNAPARRLYERLGFTLEGTLRSAHFLAGAWRDVVLYGMVQGEWRGGLPRQAARLTVTA